MDPLTIILIVAAVIIGLGLIWAAVAIIGFLIGRKAMKETVNSFHHDVWSRFDR